MKQNVGSKADKNAQASPELIAAVGEVELKAETAGACGLRGAASADQAPKPWLTDPCTQGIHSGEVFEHMAKTFWVSGWMDLGDEVGEGLSMGADGMDFAPETPDSTRVFALGVAQRLCTSNKVDNLGELLSRAAAADGVSDETLDAPTRRGNSWAEDFGYCMAMEALGSGVAWSDDHEKFPHSSPNVEYGLYEASSVIADELTERLLAHVEALRSEGKTILTEADLPPIEEMLVAGAVVVEGGPLPLEESVTGPEAEQTAEQVLLERLGIYDDLNMTTAMARYSVDDYIPWREAVMTALAEADPRFGQRTYAMDEDPESGNSLLRFKLKLKAVRIVSGEFDLQTDKMLPIEVDGWFAADKALEQVMASAGSAAAAIQALKGNATAGMAKVDFEIEWADGEVTQWTMEAERDRLFANVRGNFESSIKNVLEWDDNTFSLLKGAALESVKEQNRTFLATHYLGF